MTLDRLDDADLYDSFPGDIAHFLVVTGASKDLSGSMPQWDDAFMVACRPTFATDHSAGNQLHFCVAASIEVRRS